MKVYTTSRGAFWGGMQAFLPIIPGAIPFGLMYGVAAAEVGIDPILGTAMSIFLLAGAAQLVTVALLKVDAAAWVIILSATIVNIRFVIYSASLSSHFKQFSTTWKVLLGYFVTDQPYVLSIAYFNEYPDSPFKNWYHFGHGAALWLVWVSTSAVGLVVGAIIPANWQLGFAIPLMFIGLLVPMIKSARLLFAGTVAAIVALLAAGLPHNLGLLVAVALGIIAAMLYRGEEE
ncbi:MAG: AzlC family ABC transporter permease [Calditrichia bacterium]